MRVTLPPITRPRLSTPARLPCRAGGRLGPCSHDPRSPAVVDLRRRLPGLPAQLRGLRRRRHRRPRAASSQPARPPGRPRRRRRVAVARLPRRPRTTTATTSATTEDIDPTVRHARATSTRSLAAAARGAACGWSWTSSSTTPRDEHPWFVESRSSTDYPKRDWYWWRPARDGLTPGTPGAEPTNWESVFSGPAWTFDEASGEYYLHLFARKQPDLNWENPEVRQAVYAMMRLVARPRGRRLPDGRHQHDLQGSARTAPARRPRRMPAGGGVLGDGSASFICGPRIHEFLQEMHREVFAGQGRRLLTVGEMPGVTIEEARLFTDPARARGRHGLPVRARGARPRAVEVGPGPFDLRDLKASFGRWQGGLADVGWNSLYWDNHDQPRVVSRFGDDGALPGRVGQVLATVLHLHRGTPYVYQGEEIGMTNAPFARSRRTSATSSRSTTTARPSPPGSRPGRRPRGAAHDEPRQRPHPDAVGRRRRTPASPPARRGSPVNPDHTSVNVAAARADPTLRAAHHYRRLIALRHGAGRGPRRLHDAAARRRARVRLHPAARRHRAARARQLLGRDPGPGPPRRGPVEDAEVVVGAPAPDGGLRLGPWEGRAYRRSVQPPACGDPVETAWMHREGAPAPGGPA